MARAALLLVPVLLTAANAARAAWPAQPPPLPAPAGRVVRVSSEPALQAAVAALTSGTTVLIAPGTYRLTRTLSVKGPLGDVTIRGASNTRDDVQLVGPGRDGARDGPVPHGIWVGGDIRRMTIANLAIRDVPFHPIIFNPGPQSPHVYNVHLVNGGEQLLKTNPNPDGSGIDNGVIEYSLFEYRANEPELVRECDQVLAGRNWIIRHNLIRNIRAPIGEMAGPAILAWFSASGTIVEANTFINCQREIGFGLIDRTPDDHRGGVIRNNMIYRDRGLPNADVAIGVFDSPGTRVVHNTVLINGTYPRSIEYRFRNALDIVIQNNLLDAPIVARDGAHATVVSNSPEATADLFVNAASGDLHLRATAPIAIDRGAAVADVPVDWDGDARPQGHASDLGADEFVVTAVVGNNRTRPPR